MDIILEIYLLEISGHFYCLRFNIRAGGKRMNKVELRPTRTPGSESNNNQLTKRLLKHDDETASIPDYFQIFNHICK